MSRILARLEVATRPWHAAVDATWRRLFSPAVTRADYLEALVRTFGFVSPLESACRYTPGLDRWFDRQLTSAGLIAQDLVALGMPPSVMTRVPQCNDITTFQNVPEALGWSYSIVRAATVHDGLRSHLIACVPNVEAGCSFLEATEGRSQTLLASFGALLDQIGAQPEIANEIVAAATAAFACRQRWNQGIDREQRNAG